MRQARSHKSSIKGCIGMVNRLPKKITFLSTWWDRGPSGQVEEWETRVPEEEISRRQEKWKGLKGSNKIEAPLPTKRTES